ncbi:hypothetical protein [Variovorax sp. PCZ-1]|uniref:hypothetical protein n=1 Tax=Variovorax sp. PCZ-1 TaxID=2835533 RepID=UPI001BCEAC22|nr:hypothetical protein [Variovorax sp. PCZ-1]MBS7806088.1 hypothetical protein [Variovorax sp. PCZ-1]
MRISKREIAEIVREAGAMGIHGKRLDVSKTIDNLRDKLRLDIESHMQPYMVLLTEAVQSLIHLEQHLFSRPLNQDSSPFALQISRVRSEAVALQQVIAIGQEAAAGVLGRSLFEAIEVAMAVSIDDDFSRRFLCDEDQDKFWKSHIGYGHIYKKVSAFLVATGDSPEEVTAYIDFHKQIKNLLSGHVHSANRLAFRSACVPALANPGNFTIGQLGALSIHAPHLCLIVAEEISLFTRKCLVLTIIPEPPVPFAHNKPRRSFDAFLISVYVLQSLMTKYGPELHERYIKLIESAGFYSAD